MVDNKPTKETVRQILRQELVKFSQEDYATMVSNAEKQPKKYELDTEFGSYQVQIRYSLSTNGVVNVIGAIDGPGVRHFLGITSSITDFFSIDSSSNIEFKK